MTGQDSKIEEVFRYAQQYGYSVMVTKPDGSIDVIDPKLVFKDESESDGEQIDQ